MSVSVLCGDCRTVLDVLPDRTFQTCVTSPPYFGLRDYGHPDQMGLEPTPDEFVAALVGVFRKVWRVLRDDGTVWLNIGDTANNRRRIRGTSHQPSLNGFKELSWADATKLGQTRLSITKNGLKEKDMFGVPWLVAFALRADGWYLRQEIIWHKTFGKPEPSPDRLPNRHEQLFLLSKSRTYHFDKSAAPQGSVWSIAPTGHSGHGAAFTGDLIEPCIKAGSRPGDHVLDPFGGAGTTGLVADRLQRHATLIELNPENVEIARNRVSHDAGLFAEVSA